MTAPRAPDLSADDAETQDRCSARRSPHRREPRREVPEHRRRVDHQQPGETPAIRVEVNHRLHHVVDVALRVDAPRHREAHEFERSGYLSTGCVSLAEHDGANLDAADAGMEVQPAAESLARELRDRHVREERLRVEEYGMPAHRQHQRHARSFEPIAEVLNRCLSIAEVVLIEHLHDANGNRLEVASRESAEP